MKKIIACLALSLLTTACGWHLRGSTSSSNDNLSALSPLYVSAVEAKSELMLELRQQIKARHIGVSNTATDANYSLTILLETKDKHTTGVSSNALSSAYEITLKADYEIRIKGSEMPIKATATSLRSFNYNSSALNSAAQEELLLEKEMRRELAQQMLRRLNAAVTHPAIEKTTDK